MTFFQFCQSHWPEIWASAASLLFIGSEYLGTNPSVQSNSIFQLIQNFLKKSSGK